jgi:hypothetical protein
VLSVEHLLPAVRRALLAPTVLPSTAQLGHLPANSDGSPPVQATPTLLHLGQLYTNSSCNSGGGGASSASWRAMDALSGDFVPSAVVEHALDLIFDAAMHPLVLMCPTGDVETSVVVGCARRYCFWSVSAIFADCQLFSSMFRAGVMAQIELWRTDEYLVGEAELTRRKLLRAASQPSRDHPVSISDDGTSPEVLARNSFPNPSGSSPDENVVLAEQPCHAVWPTWFVSIVAMQEADATAMKNAPSTPPAQQRSDDGRHPHEIFRWTRNPPALDPRSTFSATDSIVEEDDD